jgi:hypothetical protein
MATKPIDAIIRVAPGYVRAPEDLRRQWEPEEPGLCMELGALVWWITDRVRLGDTDFAALGSVMEQLLGTADPAVRDAVSSCFVESLVNRVPEVIPLVVADSLLGPRGRDVARSWLEF